MHSTAIAQLRLTPSEEIAHREAKARRARFAAAAVRQQILTAPPPPPKVPRPVAPAVPLDLQQFAGMWFYDLVTRPPRSILPRAPTVRDIIEVVALKYSLTPNDLMSARRTRDVVIPRFVAMYLARTMTLRSFPDIGRRLGKRDHTTVLSGVRKLGELMDADVGLKGTVEALAREVLEYCRG